MLDWLGSKVTQGICKSSADIPTVLNGGKSYSVSPWVQFGWALLRGREDRLDLVLRWEARCWFWQCFFLCGVSLFDASLS